HGGMTAGRVDSHDAPSGCWQWACDLVSQAPRGIKHRHGRAAAGTWAGTWASQGPRAAHLLSLSRPCFNRPTAPRQNARRKEHPMDLGMTPKVKPLVEKVRAMVRTEIMPLEAEYEAEIGKSGSRWTYTKRQEE